MSRVKADDGFSSDSRDDNLDVTGSAIYGYTTYAEPNGYAFRILEEQSVLVAWAWHGMAWHGMAGMALKEFDRGLGFSPWPQSKTK
jgi:hypothetical protein